MTGAGDFPWLAPRTESAAGFCCRFASLVVVVAVSRRIVVQRTVLSDDLHISRSLMAALATATYPPVSYCACVREHS